MLYMGSKARLAKYLLPHILAKRGPGQWYVEPFAGGCNLLDKVPGPRIASDNHPYLIAMWRALVDQQWQPPQSVTEQEYDFVKAHIDWIAPYLAGYIGFSAYGGKWLDTYRRDKEGKRDYWAERYRHFQKQLPLLRGVVFIESDYQQLEVPANSLIYCDPPYAGTAGYGLEFDHSVFWQWVRDRSAEGHTVFISEYTAPDDFQCVWEKTLGVNLTTRTGQQTKTERLFTFGSI